MATLTGREKYRVNTQDLDWTEERTCRNVGSIERLVSSVAGGALLIGGLARRSWRGTITAASGAALLFRGLTGYCPGYAALGIQGSTDTADIGRRKVPAKKAIRIERSISIAQPPDVLYKYWRNMENLPKIMSHVKSVQVITPQLSHWQVDTVPGGPTVEWDAEIINDVPNERIGWRTLSGSDVDHTGSVHFEPLGNGQRSRLTVALQYVPPAGSLGAGLAHILGEDPDQKILEDLSRFKGRMESLPVSS